MDDRTVPPAVVSAADLDAMTPQQVEEVWQASLVTDPDLLPAEYVELLRRRAAARLARRDVRTAS